MEVQRLMGPGADAKEARAAARADLQAIAEQQGVKLGRITTGVQRPDEGPSFAYATAEIKAEPDAPEMWPVAGEFFDPVEERKKALDQ